MKKRCLRLLTLLVVGHKLQVYNDIEQARGNFAPNKSIKNYAFKPPHLASKGIVSQVPHQRSHSMPAICLFSLFLSGLLSVTPLSWRAA
jgi:hypothetical protein